MPLEPPEFKDYLGDGVYVRFDGYQIWVSADRYGMLHEVALEPAVFEKLRQYVESLRTAVNTPTPPRPWPE